MMGTLLQARVHHIAERQRKRRSQQLDALAAVRKLILEDLPRVNLWHEHELVREQQAHNDRLASIEAQLRVSDAV